MNSDSESEPRRHSLKQRFREETSREILAKAEEVFAELGLHGAGMAQIAERAGVAVGTLYNRFKDREALLDALLAQRREDLLEKLDASLVEHEGAGFSKQLEECFVTLFEHLELHGRFLRLVWASEHGTENKRTQMSRALFERFDVLLKRGQKDKVIRRDPEHVFTTFLMSAARGVVLRDQYGLSALAPRAAAHGVVEFFLKGAGRSA